MTADPILPAVLTPARTGLSAVPDVPDIADLVATPGCWSPSMSPDAAAVSYVSDAGGVPQLWVRPIDGGPAERVETGDDPVLSATWSPSGEWFACLIAPGGGVRTQVWVVRRDGSGLRHLAGSDRATSFLGPWSRNGALLGLSETSGPGEAAAYLVDPATGERQVLAAGGLLAVLEVNLDGSRALLRRGRRGAREIVLADVATATVRPLDLGGGGGSTDVASFAPDGSVVYVRTDVGRELPALLAVPLDSDDAPWVVAERDDAELESFAVTGDGRTAALVWNACGRSELALLDLVDGTSRPAPMLPGEVVSTCCFAGDTRHLLFTAESSTTPSGLWLTDLDTAESRLVTDTPPAWPATPLARPSLERFQADDGLELTGWLYRPAALDGPVPTVVYLHGGPEAQERPVFSPLYQALVASGVAVFALNFRGSAGFGRSFVNADNFAGRYGAIKDVADAVGYLVGRGVTDPARVACIGRSYGGYLTLAALVHYPELFAAGVDICGIADFETFFAQTEPWIADAATTKYGHPVHDQLLLRELSPLHRMDRLAAPLLVVHGAQDTNVPVCEAEQVVTAARLHGVPVRYLLFSDEGHDFGKTVNQLTFVATTVGWLAEHFAEQPADEPWVGGPAFDGAPEPA